MSESTFNTLITALAAIMAAIITASVSIFQEKRFEREIAQLQNLLLYYQRHKGSPNNISIPENLDKINGLAKKNLRPTIIFSLLIVIIVTIIAAITMSFLTTMRSNLLTLETIQFDYTDSPINHGWKVVEGDEQQITFKSIIDNKVGNAIKISAPVENYYAMEYQLNQKTSEFGNFLEIVSQFEDEDTCVYVFVNMIRDDNETQNGWLKIKIGKRGPQPLKNINSIQEWVLYLTPVAFPDTNWVKLQIDLKNAVQDTFGKDSWSFNKLIKIRFRGNLSLDYISVFIK